MEILFPRWIPAPETPFIEAAEFARYDAAVERECIRLERELSVHIAAYRTGTEANVKGLCKRFKAAHLSGVQTTTVAASESRFPGIAFVAYARPLERW
jgi:hypothetical protein